MEVDKSLSLFLFFCSEVVSIGTDCCFCDDVDTVPVPILPKSVDWFALLEGILARAIVVVIMAAAAEMVMGGSVSGRVGDISADFEDFCVSIDDAEASVT